MNLQDYTKKTSLTELSVEHDGETIDFIIKPMMAGDQEVIKCDFAKMMDASKKDEKGNPIMTGEAIRLMSSINNKVAHFVLCDAAGKRLYNNYNEMLKKVPAKVMDKIAEKIKEELETEDSLTVIEKK